MNKKIVISSLVGILIVATVVLWKMDKSDQNITDYSYPFYRFSLNNNFSIDHEIQNSNSSANSERPTLLLFKNFVDSSADFIEIETVPNLNNLSSAETFSREQNRFQSISESTDLLEEIEVNGYQALHNFRPLIEMADTTRLGGREVSIVTNKRIYIVSMIWSDEQFNSRPNPVHNDFDQL